MLFSGGTVVQRIQAFQFCMGFPGKGELPYYKMVIYYVGLRNFNFYSFLFSFLSLFNGWDFQWCSNLEAVVKNEIVYWYYDNIYILRCMYTSKMLNHKRHIHGCWLKIGVYILLLIYSIHSTHFSLIFNTFIHTLFISNGTLNWHGLWYFDSERGFDKVNNF